MNAIVAAERSLGPCGGGSRPRFTSRRLGASMARATIAMAALGETFRKFSAAAEEAALIMKALVGIGWTRSG